MYLNIDHTELRDLVLTLKFQNIESRKKRMAAQDIPSVSDIISMVMRAAFVAFNIFGNSLILTAVTQSKVFNRLTRHLIGHLAFADLVFGITMAIHAILFYGQLMTYEACIIVTLFLLSSSACSDLGICLVLAENYISVRQINSQTGMKMTLRMAWGFIISFWIIILSLSITYIVTLPEFDHEENCNNSGPYFTKIFNTIQVVMTSLILFTMLFLITQMMLIVKKTLTHLFQEETSAANLMKQRSMQKKSRLARLFTAITFGFVVSWGPITVALAAVLICPGCISAVPIASALVPLNACVNVVVYVIKDKQFREVCKKLLRAKCHQVADVSTTASNHGG